MSEKFARMSKDSLLASMAEEYARLEDVLAKLDEGQMLVPGVYDHLSAKDVLAHIAAWARLEHGWLQASLRGEEVIRYTPDFLLSGDDARDEVVMNALNEHIFKENRDRPLSEVVADLRSAHSELVELVRATSEDSLNDLSYDWWPGEPIWTSIAGNTYWHYKEHRELLEVWLSKSR